jgi:murein DD-endopeptidase MepM/ murein hydrolase activator NlpD
MSTASLALTAGGAGIALPLAGSGSAQAASVGTWDKVARCESTGDWSINSGNGFYGGLQFTQSTWSSYGGTKYAPRADQATKDQQIAIAEKVLAGQGPKAWPLCGPKAGLTQSSSSPDISPGSPSGNSGAASSDPGRQSGQQANPTPKPERAPKADKQAEPKSQGARSHTVVHGDTLSGIAADEDIEGGWKKLYADNRETVGGDPDLILPGQKLTLLGGEAKAERPADKPQSGSGSSAGDSGAEKSATGKSSAEKSSAGKSSATKSQDSSRDFSVPVSARASTPYGASGSSWSSGKHTGVDFSARSGSAVKAVTSGTVVQAGWGGSYGNQVVLKHTDGKYSQYGHLASLSVRPGQQISVGDRVGFSGSTGNATGPHLHFEVRTGPVYGTDVDPVDYLRQHGVDL